jgi:hypothetical protein
MKMEIEDGTIRPVIGTTKLAYLLHESCYCNHRLAPDFRDKPAGLGAWLLDVLFKEPPRSRPARRLSRRRFLMGLFIFEEGSRKMRRRGSTNALIIKDIQIQCGGHNGTRIAFIRTICPLKIVRNRTEAKSGAKWLREPRRIFQ